MNIKDEGFDCKNKPYKRIELKTAKDLSQLRFNRLQPLFRVEANRVSWLCKCDCGNLKIVQANHLTDNSIQSCGCLSKDNSHARIVNHRENEKYGELTVLKRIYKENTKGVFWECACSCGKHTIVEDSNLIYGNTKSCGHLRNKIEDLTGQQFNYWTVLKVASQVSSHIYWTCVCKCGTIRDVRADELKNNRSQSCGCKQTSKGADKIEKILQDHNFSYQKEYCFPDLKSPKNASLRFDFAVFNNQKLVCLIEYDGELHYQSRKDFGGIKGLKYRQKCDQIKNQYCIKHHIPLYRIPYYDLNQFSYETLMSKKYLVS